MSNINANATVTLTVNGKQAQEMLDNLKQKSVELEKAIEKAARAGNKTDLKRLQKELRQTNRQISQIESATVGVERVLKNLDKATPKELNRTLSTLKKQLNGIERGTTEWNRQCEAIKRVKHELERVNADLREGEGRWQRFNRIVNDWQTTIMGAAAAVTGLIMAGRSAVKAFADMDAEMANVRKYTGMTGEQVKDLNEEFKKMDTRTSREDLNKLAEEAGRLGKTSKEDILGFVRAADQINVALDDLGDGATLTLSKLTAIFGDEERLGTEKALLAVGSVINELSQNCTAAAPYLANFAKRMAGVGAQAKMTIPEIMGFAAVLDSQGQAVEMSATAVSKLIMDMFKQQDKVITATGINAEKFKEALTRSTNEGLLMLLERLHELGSIDVLAPVFKDMGENGARAAQVISALAGNLDMVKWEQEEATKAFNEAVSVGKEYNVQNTTVQAGLDKAKKRVKELAVELGEKLQPVMRHVISSTTLLLRFLSTMVDFFIKHKTAIVTLTVTVLAYVAAVQLQHLWSLRHIAVTKLKAAAMAIEEALLAASILKHKVLTGQITATAAAQTYFNKVLKLNPLGVVIALVTTLIALYVKFAKSSNEAAAAQQRLRDMEAAVDKSTSEEITKIKMLKKTVEDGNVSIGNRRRAIQELEQIVPGYHASLSDEGKLIGHNSDMIEIYVKQLKNMAMIKEAISRQTDLEFRYKKFSEQTPNNLMDAFFNERMNGMSEAEAAARANASLMGYRAWKAQMRRLDAEKEQLNSIIEARTKENQTLADQIDKMGSSPAKTNPSQYNYTSNTGNGNGNNTDSNTNANTDKLQAEKDWKAKEEALNKIAYATGKRNYEDYTKKMLEIEVDYFKMVLKHEDLTAQEKLDAQVGFYEAQKKLTEEEQKQLAEKEEENYSVMLATQKQSYIDGEISFEQYSKNISLLELGHLRNMVLLTKKGTKERREAEKAYQDKMLADQKQRQQETEQKAKEHQDRLAQIKKEYFGDNAGERRAKYDADLESLKEVYNLELKAAGDNAKEKLRIEEAYLKAKKALRKKYSIDELDHNKNFLEEWTEDMTEWLQSDMGKAVTGSIEVLSSGMASIFSQLTSLVQSETDIQTAAIEKRYKTEISRAEGNNYIVKKLEKQKEAEIAKVKHDANKKMFAMQVIQAIAQTATSALNAYSSAAAIPVVGWVMAPIAAAMAVTAGMLQVAAIKKQQQASEAQGYAEGGFTPKGKRDEVAGVVHKGEWVASQKLLQSPVARPMIEALDYAQRTNTIGSLRSEDVSRTIAPNIYQPANAQSPARPLDAFSERTVIVQQLSPDAQAEIAATQNLMREYASVIKQLKERLDEPFVTVNTVSGDTGIKQAQDEYAKLMRNKTPKSKRK